MNRCRLDPVEEPLFLFKNIIYKFEFIIPNFLEEYVSNTILVLNTNTLKSLFQIL